MAGPRLWLLGARPRTLPAAVAPVVVGTGLAVADGGGSVVRALLALLVALALQVGVNYANDYSDGVRGTDTGRVGPLRLVGSGLVEPARVRRAAVAALAAACAAGLVLVVLSGAWWLLVVGALAVAAAWFYTGGRRPYGYAGLGEVFVFVFFGLVAVLGTAGTQGAALGLADLSAAVAVGFLACAILVANNLRDVPTDAAAGKRTLAVRLGDRTTRTLYVLLVALPFVLLLPVALDHPGAVAALAAVVLAVPVVRTVLGGATGRDLVPVLGGTGRLELVYALLLAVGVALT